MREDDLVKRMVDETMERLSPRMPGCAVYGCYETTGRRFYMWIHGAGHPLPLAVLVGPTANSVRVRARRLIEDGAFDKGVDGA